MVYKSCNSDVVGVQLSELQMAKCILQSFTHWQLLNVMSVTGFVKVSSTHISFTNFDDLMQQIRRSY